MKTNNKTKKSKFEKFKITLIAISLFVVCVGSIELAICYWQDPHIFYKIMTPIQNAAKSTITYSKKLATDLAQNTAEFISDSKEWFDKQIQNIGEILFQPQKAEEKSEQESTEPSNIMTRINGIETLTGGNIPITYFAQNDPEWKDKLYGTDPIGVYGCGPTTLAMVINSFGLAQTDPSIMSRYCVANGYWAKESGSYHSIVQGVSLAFGANCSAPNSLDTNELITRLKGNEIAIALMGPGHFTKTGHFIILRGVTEENKILIADPISRTNSLKEWDAELITKELSMSRSNGAPLWFLSKGQ